MSTCLGTAFNAVYRHTDAVTAVFLGDGTLGEGTCHESMNMAATWKLPIIYCLVNNQYAISTKYTEAHPQQRLKTWGEGYEVPSFYLDGNDIEAVVEAVETAVDRARKGEGPTLLEFDTYRWQGHFAGDPAAYRPEDEVQRWKDRDPLKLCRKVLLEREKVSEDDIKRIEDEEEAHVQEMLKFSLESPFPTVDTATTYTYADREVETR